jgi:hypothetical protein
MIMEEAVKEQADYDEDRDDDDEYDSYGDDED